MVNMPDWSGGVAARLTEAALEEKKKRTPREEDVLPKNMGPR